MLCCDYLLNFFPGLLNQNDLFLVFGARRTSFVDIRLHIPLPQIFDLEHQLNGFTQKWFVDRARFFSTREICGQAGVLCTDPRMVSCELILAFLYASSSLTHASVDLETCDHVLGLSLFPPRKFRDFLKKSIAVSSFKDPQSWPCCRLAVLPQITADIATDAKKLQGSMIWHDDLLETRVILDFKSV